MRLHLDFQQHRNAKKISAGDEGIEPPIAVLETAVIPFN